MIANMSLSQSSFVLLLHPVVVVAHVVVVVVVDADGAGGEGLGMSQHQLLPSHWLGRLLLQFAIFWHITGREFVENTKMGLKTRLILQSLTKLHQNLSNKLFISIKWVTLCFLKDSIPSNF